MENPERELIIPREITALHEMLEGCQLIAETLELRLGCVMTPLPDGDVYSKDDPLSPPLANEIRLALYSGVKIKDILNGILDALEI